ncbi:hypothetical protein CH76_03360 [Lysinibacillus sp. BF-4]|uniref:glycerophosphoryl diester phosphodiesterase membrane domain-containing protein n=1 Tax=Lysinibacillus sp. BF-4 TaxID=1473546 RepID=UPI000506E6FC|nr:glycerophosphodiester phosphodiesterase [Lysinibacillus sp. BF-4]KFL44005.1 hypothetical protein CH76_03360 [Lysinibacillus sp. BF-4]
MGKTIEIVRASIRRIMIDPRDYIIGFMILQILQWLVAIPILSFLFHRALSTAGMQGITDGNIGQLLHSPLAIILLVVLVLLLTVFIYYELGFYFLLADFQRKQQTFTYRTIFKQLNKKSKYFLSVHTLLFSLYFMLIVPVATVGVNSSFTEQLKVPDFIVDEVMTTTSGQILWLGLMVLLFYINLRLIFSIMFFVTGKDTTILQAMKKSWQLSRQNMLLLITVLGGIILSFTIVMTVLTTLILTPLLIVESTIKLSMPIFAGLTLTLIQILFFCGGAILQPLLAEALTSIGHNLEQPSLKKVERHLVRPKILGWLAEHKLLQALVIIGFIALCVSNYFTLQKTVYQPTTQIVAHRGYANKALENTITSMEKAAEAGADFVEMDIQQTKDGKFVVYHDATLSRLANRSGHIYNMNLDELVGIPIKNNQFTDEIPSFEAYLDRAKELKMKLLVEIKTHGHETKDMEERLVDLLRAKGVANDYIIHSLDRSSLERVLAYDPTITTSYILAMSIGRLPDVPMPYLGIEEFWMTSDLLKQAEEQGKGIMVWTVNKENLLHKYVRMNTFSLITNNVDKAIEVRNSYDKQKTLYERIQIIMERL